MPRLAADSSLQFIPGVGPVRAGWFAELGLNTVGDLLEYFPFRYEIDHGIVDIADLKPGTNATIRGEIQKIRRAGRFHKSTTVADFYDGTESCRLRWFQPYGIDELRVGSIVIATGAVREYDGRIEMVQPKLRIFEPHSLLLESDQAPRQRGIYAGAADLKSALIHRVVQQILQQPSLPVIDALPPDLLQKRGLLPREQAIREIHAPANDESLGRARRRLAYEELFLLELAMALRRREALAQQTAQVLHHTPEIDARIRARFPFALTAGQNEAVATICRDLASGHPMTRLLQGDVGCGKTVVALYACLVAVANSRQAAIMAPTEILAAQHYNNIQRYLSGSRVRHGLLRGGQKKTERAALLAATEDGSLDLIVGTQALIEQSVSFANLALVVVDEQHKFGVLQRADFRTKGPAPHYLVMTATPIPRTLAMTVFGDLDVSTIREMPPGRGRIDTRVVGRDRWDAVMQYVRRRIESGEQAYVVCPQIGEEPQDALQGAADPESKRIAAPTEVAAEPARAPKHAAQPGAPLAGAPLVTVRAAFERLRRGAWKGLEIGLLHGGMKQADKDQAIAAFSSGALRALVATTVVEVGVDVANASIMIVEQADRFGLSQLHQLRGRVGRGSRDSLCALIAYDRSPAASQRLAALAETTDGFRIAEADLRLRGPGQLFGTKQHGLPELRVASLVDDFELLELARTDAFELVSRDPHLRQPEHRALLQAVRKFYGDKLKLIDAA